MHFKNCIQRIVNISLLIVLLFAGSCRKNIDEPSLRFSGTIRDDISGANISATGSIRIDGFDGTAGMISQTWKENLGTGTMNPDGSFYVSFKKWRYASHYVVNFFYNNYSHINSGVPLLNILSLDTSLFITGNYTQNILAAKMTKLIVNFRNISPLNANDRLHINLPSPPNEILFAWKFPKWENLQFCVVDPVTEDVIGGTNASGRVINNVPSGRKFAIRWTTKKGGVEQSFLDSVLCPADMTTSYMLDY